MKIKIFKVFDYYLLLSVLTLITVGILFIYSSGVNSDGISISNEYIKQIIWASIGFVLMISFAMFDYKKIQRYILYLFIAFCVILLMTRFFARRVNGARSWIGIGSFGVQPSEFCKVVFILFLAWYFENSKHEAPFVRFVKSAFIMAVPMGLILLQPDLGTASVFLPIYIIMGFVAGIHLKYLCLILFGGLLTIVFTILPLWESYIVQHPVQFVTLFTNTKLRLILILTCLMIVTVSSVAHFFFKNKKYYYWIEYVFALIGAALILSFIAGKVLKDYQLQRLIVFLDPYVDRRGSGYHIIQSKIAIGSGSLLGRGFLRGTQSHYQFLPQQSTDFIFSIFAEEAGFIGGAFVFAIYLFILLRILYIMKQTNSDYGYYIAAGIFGMFIFHFMINVGMVMGIMPITGIPLLFMSYGGSSLWAAMICVGLLMSISYRRLQY